MINTWYPTVIGKFFTNSGKWEFSLDGENFSLEYGGKYISASVSELPSPQLVSGTFWARVVLSPLPSSWAFENNQVSLEGFSHTSAEKLLLELAVATALIESKSKEKENEQAVTNAFRQELRAILDWVEGLRQAFSWMYSNKGWFSTECIKKYEASKPLLPQSKYNSNVIEQFLRSSPDETKAVIRLWAQDLEGFAKKMNKRFLEKAITRSNNYFQSVEKSPLNDEQIEAVVCNDNRVLLLASAGSGKTSTIVAKVGYVVRYGYFKPNRILLLAFNRSAAIELKDRVQDRLAGMGILVDDISVKTFHSLGLGIIGETTGKKPSVADWVESGKDLRALLDIVESLKKRRTTFKRDWDLFRIVFSNEVSQVRTDEDLWKFDNLSDLNRHWTLNGEHVRSYGELLLANWLFYNGVKYQYEQDYIVDTADASHRQYKPDFYLPDVNAYIELWALNSRGNPPKAFVGYRQGMQWKKKLHFANNTKLLEVTTAQVMSGKALSLLEKELKAMGVVFKPDPNRPTNGRKPIKDPRLIKIFRTFLSHVKGNRLTVPELRKRISSGYAGGFKYRQRLFIKLFEKIWAEWDLRLRQENSVDFDDMLACAGDYVEQGKWSSPYDLVMADEFQDASFARARIISGLLKDPNKYLFAVGDDWQGVNRFAGADSSVMREFEVIFGKGTLLKLQNTYRCPQSLCNITSQFVMKNPDQFTKEVISVKPDVDIPILIYRTDHVSKIVSIVSDRVKELSDSVSGEKVTVYILGRYNRDRVYVPSSFDHSRVTVEFMTVHSSKGLEADHVILPNIIDDALGFPSKVEDDSVMKLAMLDGESYPYAEERRLFYVALTRAKKTATLITVLNKESVFIDELVDDHGINVENIDCEEPIRCEKCGVGYLVQRVSKYGEFMGCSRYPACDGKS